MNNNKKTIFVDGAYAKRKEIPNFPALKYSVSNQAERYIKFIRENTNSKGYFNYDIIEGKNGPYISLNQYEGASTQTAQQTPQNMQDFANDTGLDLVPDINANVEDIPW